MQGLLTVFSLLYLLVVGKGLIVLCAGNSAQGLVVGAASALAAPRAGAAGGTCALNGTACPPPLWTPEWSLTLSTIDWSVAKDVW